MKKKVAVVMTGLAVASVGLISAVVGWHVLTWPPSFPDTAYPDIQASSDPAVVARGEYLFHAVAHCSICHTKEEAFFGRDDARDAVVGGNHVWEMGPLGTLRSTNISSHPEHGIASYSDAEIARVVRTGIGRDHTPALLMAAIGPMHDDDLTAILSYVRSLPPVDEPVAPTELSAFGKVLVPNLMTGFISPKPQFDLPPYTRESAAPSVERGAYLANGPAYCFGCHTPLDIGAVPLALTGPRFSGCAQPDPDPKDDAMELCAPNLTPTSSSLLSKWSEDHFVTRFRSGRAVAHSPMPWENYRQMTDADLRSIYRYLVQLEPIDRNTGPGYRKAGWTP